MELQNHKAEFEAAGISVFAISYDPVKAQSRFAEESGIDYPLLADEGSAVIKEIGLLNTLVKEDEPVYGIPFPGSYLVGEDGLVEEKFFHREYQVRATGATVLRSGFRAAVDLSASPHAELTDGDAKLAATFGGDGLAFMQHGDLYVRIELAEGLHVNGPDVPEGYFATEVRVTGPDGLRIGEPEFPPTAPFRIEGLDEQFQVFEGGVEVVVPLISALREGESVPVEVEVQYQACNDRECFLPKTDRLQLDVPVAALNMPQRR